MQEEIVTLRDMAIKRSSRGEDLLSERDVRFLLWLGYSYTTPWQDVRNYVVPPLDFDFQKIELLQSIESLRA